MSRLTLVTGFQPFGGESLNPSAEILKILSENEKYKELCHFHLLPVDFAQAIAELQKLISSNQFKSWLGIGQAGGRSKVSLERVALNWKEVDSESLPINPEPLIQGAPPALLNSLPLARMKQKLSHAKIPCEISFSAGAYVCNAVYYTWMMGFQESKDNPGLFVHVPYLPEQHQNRPNLDLKTQVQAIEIILQEIQIL